MFSDQRIEYDDIFSSSIIEAIYPYECDNYLWLVKCNKARKIFIDTGHHLIWGDELQYWMNEKYQKNFYEQQGLKIILDKLKLQYNINQKPDEWQSTNYKAIDERKISKSREMTNA